jgi:hypothetical protein
LPVSTLNNLDRKEAYTPEQRLILGVISKAGNRGEHRKLACGLKIKANDVSTGVSLRNMKINSGIENLAPAQLRRILDVLEKGGEIVPFKSINVSRLVVSDDLS